MSENVNIKLLNRFRIETGKEPAFYPKNGVHCYTDKYVNWVEHQIEEQTETVPLSVVEEVLEGCALHTDFFINGCWEAVLKEIKKKAGL